MILCVNTKSIPTSKDVQRDVNLEDIINNHTKYYESASEALKDGYAPLDFCVTVRSMYTNLVLQADKDSEKRYYTNLSNVQEFVHKGYDLIMYLTSIGLMHNVNYDLGFDEVMMKHSQFQPIGLYNPEIPFTNPIIYSHVIMSDEGVEELKKFLKEDRGFVHINAMNEFRKGNIVALLDTIIEVKEE